MKNIIPCLLILLHVASCVSVRGQDFNSVIRSVLAENRNVVDAEQQERTDERLLENQAYPYKINPTNEIMRTDKTIKEVVERKVDEVSKKLFEDREIDSMRQSAILQEYERRLESQSALLEEIIPWLNKQDNILKEHAFDIESIREQTKGVSFSARLYGSQSHIGLGQTIKYNKIDVNDGNGYSVHSGVFTVPKSGVYMFCYFLGNDGYGRQIWLGLMHNGIRINAAVSDTFHKYEDRQGGNFAILRLTKGDHVWVESWHQNDVNVDGNYGFTSFSGALLY